MYRYRNIRFFSYRPTLIVPNDLVLISISFPDILLFQRERVPRIGRVQRKSPVYWRHQQEGRVHTAESGSVQRQRHLLLRREEPTRREGNAGSNGAQGRPERWASSFRWFNLPEAGLDLDQTLLADALRTLFWLDGWTKHTIWAFISHIVLNLSCFQAKSRLAFLSLCPFTPRFIIFWNKIKCNWADGCRSRHSRRCRTTYN